MGSLVAKLYWQETLGCCSLSGLVLIFEALKSLLLEADSWEHWRRTLCCGAGVRSGAQILVLLVGCLILPASPSASWPLQASLHSFLLPS